MELESGDIDAATSSKSWRNCWSSRRRPKLKPDDKGNRKTSTVEVVELAKSKRTYYDRLLEIAEIEHTAKMKMYEAKTKYFEHKISKSKAVSVY